MRERGRILIHVTGRVQTSPRRTLRLADAGGVPPRLTTFIGRDADLAALGRLLEANRLLTLTGTGGTGKTSLAIELARTYSARFPDGVWFVPLETLVEPRLVGPAIATKLGLPEAGGRDPLERLVGFLTGRSTLLVLDNFERLLPAAPLVADLLLAADGLTIIVTSRAPLRLSGEQDYPVAPLDVPGVGEPPIEALRRAAVRLFVERAGRVRPGWAPTPAEVAAVGEICQRLDGLPLGIELAASRSALLPPRAIAERLADRLDLPGAPARDRPERQQTLEAAIAWSHDLLGASERRLLARLSVFAGGCRLDEIAAVCGPEDEIGSDVLEGLSRLVDHGLVESTPDLEAARFRLLDTIRVFAGHRLAESDEAPALQRRHARAYLKLAEDAAPNLPGRHQALVLDRLEVEHDNLRVALRWAIDADETETALRLGAALWRFWQMRAHLEEGREAMAEILDLPPADVPTEWRMRALEAAGGLHYWSADPATAKAFYVAQLEVAEALGNKLGRADALFNLAFPTAIESDFPKAQGLLDAALVTYAEAGDERAMARALWTQAMLKHFTGQAREAAEVLGHALERYEELGDDYYAALAAEALSWTALELGPPEDAIRWSLQSLRSWRQLGDMAATTIALETAALSLQQSGLSAEAVTVRAAFDALCRRYSLRPPAPLANFMPSHRKTIALDGDHAAAAQQGRAMTIVEAVEYVVRVLEDAIERKRDTEESPRPEPALGSGPDRFLREGEVWAITFDGTTIRLRDTKGLRYLARLLAEPGREIAALDLAIGPSPVADRTIRASVAEAGLAGVGGSEPVLDGEARTAYRARLVDLQAEIDEAEHQGNLGLVDRYREEFEIITRELVVATGLGGRLRGVPSAAERARQSVTKAIREALHRIEREDAALSAHLRHAIRTGTFCAYRPDPRLPVKWVT